MVDEQGVCDGNLITSRQPDDLPAFLRSIIRNGSASDSTRPSTFGRFTVHGARRRYVQRIVLQSAVITNTECGE